MKLEGIINASKGIVDLTFEDIIESFPIEMALNEFVLLIGDIGLVASEFDKPVLAILNKAETSYSNGKFLIILNKLHIAFETTENSKLIVSFSDIAKSAYSDSFICNSHSEAANHINKFFTNMAFDVMTKIFE